MMTHSRRGRSDRQKAVMLQEPIVALALVLAFVGSDAWAIVIDPVFTGHTVMGPPVGPASAAVSFARFDRSDGDVSTPWSTFMSSTFGADFVDLLGGGVDEFAKGINLYQVVVFGASVDFFEVPMGGAMTSAGYLTTAATGMPLTFEDDGGVAMLTPISPLGNTAIGSPDPGPASFDDPVDGSPTLSGYSGLFGMTGDPAAVPPIGLAIATSGELLYAWEPPILKFANSSVLFATADTPPIYGLGTVTEPLLLDGDVPGASPIPEPGTAWLVSFTPFAVLARRRRPLK